MAEADSENPFDLAKLRQIVEMMEQHDLGEVSLRKGDVHWRLRRGTAPVQMNSVPLAAAPAPAPMSPAPASPSAPAPASGDSSEAGLVVIKSPTVGTFYASASPDEPAFVTVGTKVTASTIVCLIEAMKVFNQITADVSGSIAAILVKNGDAVEFGQPLFKVRP